MDATASILGAELVFSAHMHNGPSVPFHLLTPHEALRIKDRFVETLISKPLTNKLYKGEGDGSVIKLDWHTSIRTGVQILRNPHKC